MADLALKQAAPLHTHTYFPQIDEWMSRGKYCNSRNEGGYFCISMGHGNAVFLFFGTCSVLSFPVNDWCFATNEPPPHSCVLKGMATNFYDNVKGYDYGIYNSVQHAILVCAVFNYFFWLPFSRAACVVRTANMLWKFFSFPSIGILLSFFLWRPTVIDAIYFTTGGYGISPTHNTYFYLLLLLDCCF